MIKNHLICWQAKPIDEVLQYAKYCSDEIELKQKKLKEKPMVMQIKAAQTGAQGALVPPMPPQQRAVMFQPQVRGRGRGMDMMRGPDLGTVFAQNDMQGMTVSFVRKRGTLEAGVSVDGAGWCGSARDLLCKTKCSINCSDTLIEVQTNSDDEEEQVSAMIVSNACEEYPLIDFFPMFTVKELHADLQGTVKEDVWDLTGKEVGLIKGVEPIKITLKPNAEFPHLPQYNMAKDVLMKVAQIIGDFLKQGVLKEVLSSPCN
ncbi:hypothetical protein NDU88_002183 [Pleurodeles waltl]|uniref:Uncharacterized protein n=1 Tax=Pleurodeles waltl TaxID=8319 RepID=A0AAV7W1N5_PLEWA|nr:hypothetical protein NDU88_002183 [Pleurodeles waltl]